MICPKVWKTAKYQGKVREKSGNFEVDDKWQPCVITTFDWLTYITDLRNKAFVASATSNKTALTFYLFDAHYAFKSSNDA